ncbi:MAG: GNAT family N-acetyltransferase [Ruminococcaceae bacterium]|nr:GNAT family N-acetyltransferase [Oscillospiraceae bacterium]MBQ3237340.1 GNAT family N-acetyltransferase [Oscillospiraceae bacterium]
MDYRKITAEDVPALAKIYAETFNSDPWYDKWTHETAEKRLLQMAQNGGFFGLLSFDESGITGMIMGESEQYFDGVIFNIKEFCVKNELRGKGIGTELLAEFERCLKSMGIRETVLMTNLEDEEFYKKRGFHRSRGVIYMGKEL